MEYTACYAKDIKNRYGKDFENAEPREGIVEQVKKDMKRLDGKTIFLCFTCDPYPAGMDTTTTREVIKAIKNEGGSVKILTKNPTDAVRDFDLLEKDDWFGITYTGGPERCEPNAEQYRIPALFEARKQGIKTWISYEPVLDDEKVLEAIRKYCFTDEIKIGKLNHKSLEILGLAPINWGEFGCQAELICKRYGINYTIKDDLRKEMQKVTFVTT